MIVRALLVIVAIAGEARADITVPIKGERLCLTVEGSDPEGPTSRTWYFSDRTGELRRMVTVWIDRDPKAVPTRSMVILRDGENRVWKRVIEDKQRSFDHEVFRYDGNGRLAAVDIDDDGDGKVDSSRTFTWTGTAVSPAPGPDVAGLPPWGSAEYVIDHTGFHGTVTEHENKQLVRTRVYDAAGRLETYEDHAYAIRVSAIRDRTGRRIGDDVDGEQRVYVWRGGQLAAIRVKVGNKIVPHVEYKRDARGRIIKHALRGGDGSIFAHTYRYLCS